MDNKRVIDLANRIYLDSVGKMPTFSKQDFYLYIDAINHAVKQDLKKHSRNPWFKEWATAWRTLCDRFDQEVTADPLIIYKPAHGVAEAFHKSTAFVRYFRAGNRTGKTQTGISEDGLIATNRQRWRPFPSGVHTIGIISFEFSKYLSNVFMKKMIEGEEDNPYAPMFPESGRWFKQWRPKEHTLHLQCPECAVKWTPTFKPDCKHQGSQITLFSAESGHSVIEGFSARVMHIDEHVPEPFYTAARQRLQTVESSCMLVTGTPLSGTEGWENRRLASRAAGPKELNTNIMPDGQAVRDVEMFEISQYDAGLSPRWKIEASARDMDEFEREIRIFGRPAPLAENPVFNRRILSEQKDALKPGVRGTLEIDGGIHIKAVNHPLQVLFHQSDDGPLRVWEAPQEGATYVIGADAAAGVSEGDFSCASVLKVVARPDGEVETTLVAQWHGYCNVLDYADVLKLLGFYYNIALVVIELTGGHGRATMIKLKKEYFYPNIFLDTSAPENLMENFAGRYGVETSAQSKPAMVGALQMFINKRLLTIWCRDTMQELVAFAQEKTESRLSVRYRGAGGSNDDRVMSLCIAVYVIVTQPQYCFFKVVVRPLPPRAGTSSDNIFNKGEHLPGIALERV